MRTIYRFTVRADDQDHDLYMSGNSRPLRVENNGVKAIDFWAEVETTETFYRRFRIAGTGQPLPDGAVVWGTAPRNELGLIWHLIELPVTNTTANAAINAAKEITS